MVAVGAGGYAGLIYAECHGRQTSRVQTQTTHDGVDTHLGIANCTGIQAATISRAYHLMYDGYGAAMVPEIRTQPITVTCTPPAGLGAGVGAFTAEGGSGHPHIAIGNDQTGNATHGGSLLLSMAHEFGHSASHPTWQTLADGSFTLTEQVNEWLMRDHVDANQTGPGIAHHDPSYTIISDTVRAGNLTRATLANAQFGGNLTAGYKVSCELAKRYAEITPDSAPSRSTVNCDSAANQMVNGSQKLTELSSYLAVASAKNDTALVRSLLEQIRQMGRQAATARMAVLPPP